jgi:hypothetical protein
MKINYLLLFSVLYLISPSVLFYLFWFDLVYGISGLILFLLGYFLIFKSRIWEISGPNINVISLGLIALFSLAIVIFTGRGGIFPQIYDFWGHNAKLNDLFLKPWPSTLYSSNTYYAYYFGYYLSVVAFSKIFFIPLIWSNIIWISLGVFLGFCWLYLFAQARFKILVLFLLISTPSIYFLNKITFGFYSETVFLKNHFWLHDFFKGLQWEPHQLLPAFLMAAIVIAELRFKKRLIISLLLLPCLLIWSPFLSLGLFCILLFYYTSVFIFQRDFSIFFNLKFIFGLLMVGLAMVPFLAYFMSNEVTSGATFLPINSGFDWFISYFIFVFFNFLIFFFLFYSKKFEFELKIFLLSVIVFCLVAGMFQLGKFNDFLIKATLLPIIVLHIYFVSSLTKFFEYSLIKKSLMMFVFFIGFSGTFSNIHHQIVNSRWVKNPTVENYKPFAAYNDIDKLLRERFSIQEAIQYRGNMNSFYARVLASKVIKKSLDKNKKMANFK